LLSCALNFQRKTYQTLIFKNGVSDPGISQKRKDREWLQYNPSSESTDLGFYWVVLQHAVCSEYLFIPLVVPIWRATASLEQEILKAINQIAD
jgi:hypothetical protein